MFSTGQLIFALFFILAFTVVLIVTYRKDKTIHKKNYKGFGWVGLGFTVFVIILFLIKHMLNK
ncbi:hypothetical protein [Poritiphilus flavus]|uniref:Uncharacterized protein n=1 Tax=Poritiphilus flavus TaxID=2697053 RepID=A0A6L9E9A6_9FLAO|nr:hypothetical protein [Poritiphilus flavus]NAS11194.1 hypothetical protein [Poritiphilus flavus]